MSKIDFCSLVQMSQQFRKDFRYYLWCQNSFAGDKVFGSHGEYNYTHMCKGAVCTDDLHAKCNKHWHAARYVRICRVCWRRRCSEGTMMMRLQRLQYGCGSQPLGC